MGLIRQLAASRTKTFPGQNEGSRLWREAFGTDKERTKLRSQRVPPLTSDGNGGSWGRSAVDGLMGQSAMKRLLQALGSMAPGGWSDDRYAQTRNYLGVAYIAIHRIATHLRRAEFAVYHKDKRYSDGKRYVTPDEYAYNLVHLLEKPNEDDSFGDLMVEHCQQLNLTGMSLTWTVPSVKGPPCRLYPIKTATAIPQPAVNPDYPDGYYRIQPVYPYGPFSSYPTPSSAVGAPIPAQQMLRIKYTHPLLRYDGYSPQTGMNTWLDAFNMIDSSREYSMKGGVNPSAVLEMGDYDGAQPFPEAEIERIVADFEATVQSPENMGKLYVAPPGSELKAWGYTPDKMMYESGWDQLSSALLGGFGITKPAAGIVEDSSYSTLFATLKQLYWVTLEPMCEMIAEKYTRHLAPHFGDDLVVEIRCKPIDDHDIALAKIDKGQAAKCITKNQVLRLLDLPTTREKWGNDIAGDPSPNEMKQQEKEQQAGQQANPNAPVPPEVPSPEEQPNKLGVPEPGAKKPEEARPSPPEVEASRPSPEGLSEGALGPRKHLELLRKHYASSNGHHVNGNGRG